MSWRATACVKELTHNAADEQLTASEKLLLFVLADYYDEERQCASPSMPRLARESLMSPRNAMRVVESLEAGGVLSVVRHEGVNNVYDIVPLPRNTRDNLSRVPVTKNRQPVTAPVTKDCRTRDTAMSPLQETKDETTNKTSGAEAPVVSRHATLQSYIMEKWKTINGTVCPWDGSCAKQLSELLKSVPKWDMPTLERCVDERFASDCNKADHPTKWLCNRSRRLTDYINGPLDRFGNSPKGGSNGNSADARRSDNEVNIRRAASRLGLD